LEKILLETAKLLNDSFHCIPILYASFAMEKVVGRSVDAHDIDLLLDHERLNNPAALSLAFKRAGFMHLHENPLTFQKAGIDVELADREKWFGLCGFSAKGLLLREESGCQYFVLDADNLLKLYRYLLTDPLRPLLKKQRDQIKIQILEQWLAIQPPSQ